MHGKTSLVTHTDKGVFKGIKNPFTATRYHSLAVKRDTFPDCLNIDAEAADGEVMGMSHKARPIFGVQFHPEKSGDVGLQFLRNFLQMVS